MDAACGGIRTAMKFSTSNIPKFEIEKVASVYSCGCNRFSLARSISASRFGRDIVQRLRAAIANDRCDQAVVDADGDADIDVRMPPDGLTGE